MPDQVGSDELKAFVEKLERLAEERKDISEQEKEVKAEIKSRGYDTAIVAKIVKLRAMDPDKRAEEEATMDMYKAAVGLD